MSATQGLTVVTILSYIQDQFRHQVASLCGVDDADIAVLGFPRIGVIVGMLTSILQEFPACSTYSHISSDAAKCGDAR